MMAPRRGKVVTLKKRGLRSPRTKVEKPAIPSPHKGRSSSYADTNVVGWLVSFNATFARRALEVGRDQISAAESAGLHLTFFRPARFRTRALRPLRSACQ